MNTRSTRLSSGRLTSVLCLLFSVLCLLFTACTSTTFRDPSGAKFTRTSFLNRQSVGKVEVRAGDKSLTMEGYSNEQTEVAAAVAGAVAKALVPAVTAAK